MPFKVDFKMAGENAIREELERIAREAPAAMGQALYAEGFAIQALAQDKAPFDEGLLEKSAYTAPPVAGPDGPSVETGFGTRYAVVQHERTEFKHPKKGEAKYLEKAANARAAGMAERLGKRARAAIESGSGVQPLAPTSPTGGKP